jgi:hypothetical protein
MWSLILVMSAVETWERILDTTIFEVMGKKGECFEQQKFLIKKFLSFERTRQTVMEHILQIFRMFLRF